MNKNMVEEQDFFSKNKGKLVHVEYFDEDRGHNAFVDGTLRELFVEYDNDQEPIAELVVIESDTDHQQIARRLIKKIYLKEDGKQE